LPAFRNGGLKNVKILGLEAYVRNKGSPSADFAAVASIEAEGGEAETEEQ
jgi:hypothetical protein